MGRAVLLPPLPFFTLLTDPSCLPYAIALVRGKSYPYFYMDKDLGGKSYGRLQTNRAVAFLRGVETFGGCQLFCANLSQYPLRGPLSSRNNCPTNSLLQSEVLIRVRTIPFSSRRTRSSFDDESRAPRVIALCIY